MRSYDGLTYVQRIGGQDHDAVGRVLHERAEPRLGGRDARLGLAALGDVVHVDDDALDDRVVELVRHRDLAPPQPTVAMADPHVRSHRRSGNLEQRTVVLRPHAREILELHDGARVAPADQLVDRVPGERLDRLGREHDRPGLVEHDDRVGRVDEQPTEPVLAARERRRRDLAFAGADPQDAHHEHEPGRHQRGDSCGVASADHARDPTQRDADLRERETHETPHRRREDRRRAVDRDALRRAEDVADREHRTPTRRVDHRRRRDDLRTDPRPERQGAASRAPVLGDRRQRDRADDHADQQRDRHRCDDPRNPQRDQRGERERGHDDHLSQAGNPRAFHSPLSGIRFPKMTDSHSGTDTRQTARNRVVA